MEEKYLPIGTVCLLKEAKKRVMITGYAATGKETGDRVFDYMGCIYPEGIITTEKTLLFDHDKVDKLYYMGYMDDEFKKFHEKLKQYVEKKANDVDTTSDGLSIFKGIFSTSLLAFLMASINLIYQNDKLNLGIKILIHGLCIYI